jgi:hypothetical protein
MAKIQARPPTAIVTDGMEGAAQESASTRDLSDMSGDTTKALQDSSSMISTTSTQLPSQQKSLITAKENERTQRYGGGVAGNIMNTIFGGVSGPSVREAVKERYSSIFRTPEEGEQAYTDTMNYMEEVRTKGEASTIPDLPPKMLADIQVQMRKAKKYETFERNLVGVVDNSLQNLKAFIVTRAPNAQTEFIKKVLSLEGKVDTSALESRNLPEAVQKQIKEFMTIKKETIQGSTSVFNNTGNNSAYSSSQEFLYTSIDGKDQMTRFFDRMRTAAGESTASKSKTSNESKQPSNLTRKRGNEETDISGLPNLSTEQLLSMSNTDNKEDFQKKYKSKFLGAVNTSEGLAKKYKVEGSIILVGDGFKNIKQLAR